MAFADVEVLTIAYLNTVADLNGVTVATRVRDERDDEFVQVRRVGGVPVVPVRESVRLDVHCWAVDAVGGETRATQLASIVRTAMWALAGTTLLDPAHPVYQVGEFLSPRSLDDPSTGTPRVWATYEIVIRADDIVHVAPSVNP